MGRISHVLAFPMLVVCACATGDHGNSSQPLEPMRSSTMDLGAFSISLAVRDLTTSRAFYEKLGFRSVGGDPAQNWLILRNGDCNLGLFQGMFEKNILTFNPGWSHEATPLAKFTDVREIQRRLEAAGLTLLTRCDESTQGPASVVLQDPDGNQILLDQHR
jgi:catechol 2,3-dioxygenase-like lactoylglutathione lyase family enzyme